MSFNPHTKTSTENLFKKSPPPNTLLPAIGEQFHVISCTF